MILSRILPGSHASADLGELFVQQNVTDAQPHTSFGSAPLFTMPVEDPELEDIVDLTSNDKASYFTCKSYVADNFAKLERRRCPACPFEVNISVS